MRWLEGRCRYARHPNSRRNFRKYKNLKAMFVTGQHSEPASHSAVILRFRRFAFLPLQQQIIPTTQNHSNPGLDLAKKFQPCRTLPLVVVLISATISSVAGTFWLDNRLRQNAMMSSLVVCAWPGLNCTSAWMASPICGCGRAETRERSTAG